MINYTLRPFVKGFLKIFSEEYLIKKEYEMGLKPGVIGKFGSVG